MKLRRLAIGLSVVGLALIGYLGGREVVSAFVQPRTPPARTSIIDPRNAIVFTSNRDETRLQTLLESESHATTWLLVVRQGCWSCSAEVRAYRTAFESRSEREKERFLTVLVVDTIANWDQARMEHELGTTWPVVKDNVYLADPFMAREWVVTVFPTLLRWSPERSPVAVEVARGPGFVEEFATYDTNDPLFPSTQGLSR